MKRTNNQPKEIKRPYATIYFRGANDKLAAHSSNGACTTERNAIRSSVPRIFDEQWAKVWIVDRRSGVAIHTVDRDPRTGGLRTRFGGR